MVFALALVALFASTAAAKSSRAAKQVRSAQQSVRHIPKKSWARGKRTAVLRQSALALKQLKRRKTCDGLFRSERFRGGLRDRKTWKHGKPPRKSLKKPLGLLAKAGKSLLKQAGRRCAVPQKVSRGIRRNHGEPLGQRVEPPEGSPEQGEDEADEAEARDLEQGKLKLPKKKGAQADDTPDPHLPGAAAAARPFAQAAADPFTFFRSTDLGATLIEVPPSEPTAAIGGGVAWYTGNSSVALSTNAGRTFTEMDPATVLPDNGLAFCCDQVVSYDPLHQLFVWISQYWCPAPDARCSKEGSVNRVRLAIASPQDLIRNAATPNLAWTYWDLTPKDFGMPKDAWFDRSDLSVDDWYVNWTVDVLRGGKTKSILARYPLQALERKPARLNWFYQTDDKPRYSVAQGTHDGTVFVTANTQSQFRAYSWERAADKLFRHDIDHPTVPVYSPGATGADGGDWLSRQAIFAGYPDTATISGDSLYVATTTDRAYCTSKCDSKTPELKPWFQHPAVYITEYNLNDWKLLGDQTIWRSDTAYAWPALATDRAGDVGIGLRSAAVGANPGAVAGFLTPTRDLNGALTAVGNPLTGDYYSLRPGRTRRSFVMSAESVSGMPTAAYHWNFIEFGRGPSPYVSPPTVSLTAPTELQLFMIGDSETYTAVGTDPVDGPLPVGAYKWTYDGNPILDTGPSVVLREFTSGVHTMTVTVTNGDGASASATVHIRVKAPPQPGAPIVHISDPTDGLSLCANASDAGGEYRIVSTTATATDPSVPPGALTYSWTDSIDGGARQTISTALSPPLKLYLAGGERNTIHDLRLTATNSTGSTSDDVRVTIKDSLQCLG